MHLAIINKDTWKCHFFPLKEAQEILDMGAVAFAEYIAKEQPEDTLFFLIGAGFDLYNNGFEQEGLALIEEAKNRFPDTELKFIPYYLETIKESDEDIRLLTIDKYANRIYKDYDNVEVNAIPRG
jgi:hypothetical protein